MFSYIPLVSFQRWVRAKLMRCRYLRFVRNIRLLQQAARDYLAKRQRAASVVQAAALRWLAKRRRQRLHQAALTVQVIINIM